MLRLLEEIVITLIPPPRDFSSIFFSFVTFQCKETVCRHLNISKNIDDSNTRAIRQSLANLFEKKLSLDCVSYRVADELPAQLAALKDKEKLLKCLSSIFVFVHLYRRGRLTTLVNYWKILSKDTSAVKDVSYF